MEKKEEKGITVKKNEDFSEWFTQLYNKAELADIRYNVKGFVVYRPWATISMNKMYDVLEEILQRKGHGPLITPSLIPESNFNLEREHVEGFAPEVFWVTEHGKGEKFEEKLALRPTSETVFYQMFSNWIRSYKDLPLKTYQRGQVWRYEGKATRPFFRGREFYWIEAHDAFKTFEESKKQVVEDMETTEELLLDNLAIPFIFFRRPAWDKFAGAVDSFAADALMPSGKVLQLPSTHLLGDSFSKAFDVKFRDKDGKEKYCYLTCYGPAISRIYGALIALHGDDKGLVLPFDIAPLQIIIVPIIFEDSKEEVFKKCEEVKKLFEKDYLVKLDDREDISPGEKFNEWEMKGVPIRIEIGPEDLKKKSIMVFRRDLNEKKDVKESEMVKEVESIRKSFTSNMIKKAKKMFEGNIIEASSLEEIKKGIENEKIVKTCFCSIDKGGEGCAEKIEKEIVASVRGTMFGSDEKSSGKCSVCGKEAKEIVYIAKSY